MRHRRRHKSLHLSGGVHRSALRHLAQSVFRHGRVETTLERAKEVRRHIDHLITLGKEGSLTSRRRALQILGEEGSLRTLFNEVAPLFKKRQGGYTRVVRSWTRIGDGVQLAILELTEQLPLPQKKEKEVKVKEKKPQELKPSLPEAKRPKEAPSPEKPKPEKKSTGFLGSLRRFLKPKDRSSS